jgi:E3 ubiquitin-protein ligase RAD18
MRKDFDSAGWSASYDTDFKQLIANARKKSDAVVRSTIPSASPVAANEPQSSPVVEASEEVTISEVPASSAAPALSPNPPNGVVLASTLMKSAPPKWIPGVQHNPEDPDL